MKESELQALINKYSISRSGDKLLVRETTPEELAVIRAAKPEIIEYLMAKEETERKRIEQEIEAFGSIPGVRELRAARAEWAEWHEERIRRMDDEMLSSILLPPPESSIKDLEKQFPDAAWALKIEYECNSDNYEIHVIANEAYQEIVKGVPMDEVKEKYNAAKGKFVEKHMWD